VEGERTGNRGTEAGCSPRIWVFPAVYRSTKAPYVSQLSGAETHLASKIQKINIKEFKTILIKGTIKGTNLM
jgi:hypothetical protein